MEQEVVEVVEEGTIAERSRTIAGVPTLLAIRPQQSEGSAEPTMGKVVVVERLQRIDFETSTPAIAAIDQHPPPTRPRLREQSEAKHAASGRRMRIKDHKADVVVEQGRDQ